MLHQRPSHMTAATTTICYNPSSKLLGTKQLKLRYLKKTSFLHRFFASRSVICGGGLVPGLGRNKHSVVIVMNGPERTSAFKGGNNDEHVQVLEQQAFIDVGSSEFGTKLLFHDLESTLNRLSKWIVTAFFGAFILWRHDGEALWFTAGSFLNAMLSMWLKKLLNQKRPSTLKSDPGMPSSHAQSIFFTVMFIILSIVELLGINEFTITSSGLALAFGSYFSYLRVSQKLHTISQVVVGAVIGSICSILWYWLWHALMQDVFMTSLWVRIIIVFVSAGICIGFLLHVIYHWLKDE